MSKLYIIGAGGHGQVVLDCAKDACFEVDGFLDDNDSIIGKSIQGIKVLGKVALAKEIDGFFVVAVGDNFKRKKVVEWLMLDDSKFATVIHPRVIIGSNVEVLPGSMILGGVVMNTSTFIGKHTILNTSSSVDHHNKIGDFVHIAPGVHMGGNVIVGEGAFIGVGASIIPGINIGKWSIIGAGSVVINDVPDYATVVGNPGKIGRAHV